MIFKILQIILKFELKDFEKKVRNPLIIFLTKSKFVIKMIENSQNFYQNDIFLLKNEDKLKTLHQSIEFVTLATQKQSQKNYNKMGRKMQRFFYALAKANKQKPNYARCLKMIQNKVYFDEAIDVDKLAQMRHKLDHNQTKEILNLKAILNYVGNVFDKQVEEMVEMQLCFPDPEFLYLYYQLIDSRWTLMGLKMYSEFIQFEKKLYLPLELFEGEFEVNREFPQTRVRNLSNREFLEELSGDFLIQSEFLSKRKMTNASKPKYREHFRKSLREYLEFDIDSIRRKKLANSKKK